MHADVKFKFIMYVFCYSTKAAYGNEVHNGYWIDIIKADG
jgi:hypothetical protein